MNKLFLLILVFVVSGCGISEDYLKAQEEYRKDVEKEGLLLPTAEKQEKWKKMADRIHMNKDKVEGITWYQSNSSLQSCEQFEELKYDFYLYVGKKADKTHG